MVLVKLGRPYAFGAIILFTIALMGCDVQSLPSNQGTPTMPVTVATPMVVPTPMAGKGNVRGRLLIQSEGGKPFRGGILYLGRVIHADRPDAPPFVAFSAAEDAKEFSRNDSSGEFYFVNVVPGEYGLLIDQIAYSSAIEDNRTHSLVIVKVTANSTADLADVYLP